MAAAGSGLASYFSVFHKLLANRLGGLAGLVRRAAEQQLAMAAQRQQGQGEGQAGVDGEALRSAVAAEMGSLVKELQGSCEHSLHTYLHVQVRGARGGREGRTEGGHLRGRVLRALMPTAHSTINACLGACWMIRRPCGG